MVQKGDEACTSINFHFHAWYEVGIRFSDNPQQKETIDGIIWLKRKKCLIYRLDILFSITHVAQLMVSKMNFCQRNIHRYLQWNIQRGIPNFIPCQEVEKWQWLIFSMWHLVEISGEIPVYADRNVSNFNSEEPRCF